MGWLTGYAYRKKGAVNATAAGVQTNYQMQVLVGESIGALGEDVHCGNNCQDFPNDIRFTGADGVTKHDYWVQSVTGTTPNRLATIWIEVASIPASGDVDLYMYYGKGGDSGESDGSATFLLYNMTGIAAFYHLNEAAWDGTSGEVNDETGNYDGTAHGNADTVEDGFERCGVFDGVGDYVTMPNALTFDNDTVYSLECYVKPTVGAYDPFITIGLESTTNQLSFSMLGSSKKLSMQTFGANDVTSDLVLTLDAWNHVVVVHKAAGHEITSYDFYLNGVKQTSNTKGGTLEPYPLSTTTALARAHTNVYYDFPGRIDEVRIYDRIITQAEVTALYNNYMEKMGSYYNVRKYASPEPTWGTWEGQTRLRGTKCYAFIIS